MQVCRICLVRDVELHDIDIEGLKSAYETLTNCLLTQDGFPEKLCWECRARLLSCARFRAKALRGHAQLTAVTLFNHCNTQKLEQFDREKHALTSSLLSKTYVNHFDVELQCGEAETSDSLQTQRVKEEWDSESDANETAACSDFYVGCEVKSEPAPCSELLQPRGFTSAIQYSETPEQAVQHEIKDEGQADEVVKIQIEIDNETAIESPSGSTASNDAVTGNIVTATNIKTDNSIKLNWTKFEQDNSSTNKDKSMKESLDGNDNTFACSCGSTFAMKSILIQHMKTQHNGNASTKYNYKGVTKTYFHRRQEEKCYKCNICEYKTPNKAYLKKHTVTQHLYEKHYTCSRCDYKCNRRHRLMEHLMVHSGEKPYKCNACSYRSIAKRDLKWHLETGTCAIPAQKGKMGHSKQQSKQRKMDITNEENHARSGINATETVTRREPSDILDLNPKSLFQCDKCGQHFEMKSELRKHIHTHMLWEECETTFVAKRTRARPERKPEDKNVACPECDFKTEYLSTLRIHQRIHNGEKPYKCDLCEYRARRAYNLALHFRRVHNAEKLMKCNRCSRSFMVKRNLLSHQSTCTGGKRLYCSHCSYSCSAKSFLVVHERTHTGERPYKCEFCDHRSIRKSHMKLHQMRKH